MVNGVASTSTAANTSGPEVLHEVAAILEVFDSECETDGFDPVPTMTRYVIIHE
jgi:hypothetical protein